MIAYWIVTMGQSSVSKKIRDLQRLIRRKGNSNELDDKMKKLLQENQSNLLKGTHHMYHHNHIFTIFLSSS